ncbi:MAG TPA: type II CAAX endopeptidase family protein [Candidatus Eisenbacteria bacterium]|nr:type II CAAX endopeptidase family protein [Candidatus Eisenbacteria bacterium]
MRVARAGAYWRPRRQVSVPPANARDPHAEEAAISDPVTLERPPAPATAPDDAFAARLRGFGPVGLLAIVAILLGGNAFVAPLVPLPVGAGLALLWAWRSRTPWRAIGWVRPRRWAGTLVLGAAIGVALKLAMKAVVMPLLGAPAVNPAYHFLAGNRALLPFAIYAMLEAGIAEETVFRGFLFERFGRLWGRSPRATAATTVIVSALFALAHLQGQGVPGAEQAAFTGLALAGLYLASGSLALPMAAHAAFDLTALAMIYADWETRIAHLLFR